jgi:tetratricopeptide (TPR) repeat protein
LRRFDEAETALAQAEAIPNPSSALRLRLLQTRAFLSGLQGNHKAAIRADEQLLREARSLGDAARARVATVNLAEENHASGETRRAIELVREMLAAERAAGDRNMLANVMANFAAYLVAVDDFPEACATARELIRELAPRDPTRAFIAMALEPLALALAVGGDLARAAALEGYADAALRAQGFEREFTETTTHDRLMALLAERLAPDDLARRLAEGVALSPEAAIALALEEP